MDLRDELIHIAHVHPETRKYLLPLIHTSSSGGLEKVSRDFAREEQDTKIYNLESKVHWLERAFEEAKIKLMRVDILDLQRELKKVQEKADWAEETLNRYPKPPPGKRRTTWDHLDP